MNKRRSLSSLLSLVVAVITVFALGGFTALADGEASISISINDELITGHSRFTNFNMSIDSLNFGTVIDAWDEPKEAHVAWVYVYGGTLTDGNNNSIPFLVGGGGNHMPFETGYYRESVFAAVKGDSFIPGNYSFSIYIDPDTFRSAAPGTYTGKLDYSVIWDDSTWTPIREVFASDTNSEVDLTLIVPEKAGDDLEWIYDPASGELDISGNGNMYDYSDSSDTPWAAYIQDISKIVIGEGVTGIGNNAFKNCTCLGKVEISSTVTSIGADAFKGCTSTDTIICSADPSALMWNDNDDFKTDGSTICKVMYRYRDAFASKFTDVNVTFEEYFIDDGTCGDNIVWILDADYTLIVTGSGDMTDYGYDEQIYDYVYAPWYSYRDSIKEIIIEGDIKSIGDMAFSQFSTVNSVTIPDSVEEIGYSAFYFCYYLDSVELPASLKTIGESAFYNTGLTSVDIPDGVTKIGSYAFYNCAHLKTVNMTDSVTSLGSEAFYDCYGLESVRLSSSLTEIGKRTFSECEELKSIDIPDGVTSIGENAFFGCTSLEFIVLPDSVTVLGDSAFNGCTSLKSIELPEGIIRLGSNTFYYCVNLESITIPDAVTYIGAYCFNGCRALQSVTIPNSVNIISTGAFQDCESLRSVTIPGNVQFIGDYCFESCDSLKYVTVLEGVKNIGSYAFRGCGNIYSVILPGTLTSIDNNAFAGCNTASDVYIYADPDNLYWEYPEGNFNSNTKLHVPYEYRDKYIAIFGDIFNIVSDAEVINIGSGTHLYGHSLSLGGNIGVKFYMTLDDSVTATEGAYMLFSVNGRTQKIMISDITPDERGYSIFCCNVNSTEMTDVITAQIYIADDFPVGESYSYTVRDYAAYILNHSSSYADALPLVKAMLNYGARAQICFGHNTSYLANSILADEDKAVANVSPSSLTFAAADKIVNDDIVLSKVSLSLKSEISLSLFFTGDTTGLTFKAGNKVLTSQKSGSYTKVTIEGIPAQSIDKGFEVTVYNGDTAVGSITYSPMNYCYNVLPMPEDGTITAELKDVICALCGFYEAAKAYNT